MNAVYSRKEGAKALETRVVGSERMKSVTEIADWANALIGQELPGVPGYQVVSIIRFQLMQEQAGYTALLLVEVTKIDSGEEPLAIRVADIIEIEQITSAIDDAPGENQGVAEL